ncbi:hypothetical protein Acr_23g0009720 [Actinidia rufa]|uniref:Uncharacterized protein n=1 Tax=Actinidia rufa TaxID=165716 RepID=A0A7J0GP42_9ERIC|nr:hypothetical protein Acr_23g0009720 [Actinidia rufa]
MAETTPGDSHDWATQWWRLAMSGDSSSGDDLGNSDFYNSGGGGKNLCYCRWGRIGGDEVGD